MTDYFIQSVLGIVVFLQMVYMIRLDHRTANRFQTVNDHWQKLYDRLLLRENQLYARCLNFLGKESTEQGFMFPSGPGTVERLTDEEEAELERLRS